MIDFSRCRDVWVPDDTEEGGHWSPPPESVKIGVEQIVAHPFFLLADDMGMMKTAQAIIAAQMLSEMDLIDRVITIAPLEVRRTRAVDQQLGQLAEHLWTGKRVEVTESHQKIRTWVHEPEGTKTLQWIVTNYEYIRRPEHLLELQKLCGPGTLLILDESSAVRGYSSQQTEACMRLRWLDNARGNLLPGVPRCGRVLLLNGTPVAESPLDMLMQGNIMHPDILQCRYLTHYKARYAILEPVRSAGGRALTDKRGNVIRGITGWHHLDDLQQRFAPYILRREAAHNFALAPVGLEVKLTDTTWRIYKDMRDEMVAELESGDLAVTRHAAVRSMRLSQITSGFVGGVESNGQGSILDDIRDMVRTLSADPPYTMDDIHEGQRTRPTGVTAADKMREFTVQAVGREKLDFTLQWQREQLKHDPHLKLLAWCRFVPELERYLEELRMLTGTLNDLPKWDHQIPATHHHEYPEFDPAFRDMRIGAVCGQALLGGNKKDERAEAMRLLHPATTPTGSVTVGGTYGTGSLGLNFTACHTVLDISYGFEPWKKQQADARVNRQGQRKPVSFYYLIAVGPKGQKTIDHHIILHRLGKTNVNAWTTKAWVQALMED